MRVMLPPPPAYVFKAMEAKLLGPDYPSPDTSFEENWEITHPPRDPPQPAKDLRHLLNAAQKIEAWKEKCRDNAIKRRIAKLKVDIERLQGSNAEKNNNVANEAPEKAEEVKDILQDCLKILDVSQEQEDNEDQDDEANQEIWLDLNSFLLILFSLLLILFTTNYISSAPQT